MKLRCPVCRDAFSWDPRVGYPDNCLLCKAVIGHTRADDDIVMPFVRSSGKTAQVDKLYRDMEKGSEVRAEAAASMLGIPASEMSGMKMTDMNDRRDCEIAEKIAPSPVTQFMDAHPNVSGHVGGQAVEYGNAVMQGAHPNAGARMRTAVQRAHPAMVREHAVGYDPLLKRAVAPSTDVVSERPSNEVMQPGYRRRG